MILLVAAVFMDELIGTGCQNIIREMNTEKINFEFLLF
jgi:hypothetical protein